MKLTLQEIEDIIASLQGALIYTKEARHVAKKVYGDEREISQQLKYAYQHVSVAMKLLEGQGN